MEIENELGVFEEIVRERFQNRVLDIVFSYRMRMAVK
jgi:hypothetical protein